MRALFALLVVLATSAPLAAQSTVTWQELDAISIRGVAFADLQQFAAKTTFEATLGESLGRFFGGGFVLGERGSYLEFTVSRFRKVGQRALLNDGQVYGLNIPLTATITPIELSGGYRFWRRSSVIPYAGGGIGSYKYQEVSAFADTDEDVDVRHVGYLAVGGVEIRFHRWVGVAADYRYTHIRGILGEAGLSKDAGEDDLGGSAIRIKILLGVGR